MADEFAPMFVVRVAGLDTLIQSTNRVADAVNNLTTLLGEKMSDELIASVKEALANFSTAEANEDAQAAAAAELAAATIASLNEQIAELQAGRAVDEAALVEVRDALVALTPPGETPVDEG